MSFMLCMQSLPKHPFPVAPEAGGASGEGLFAAYAERMPRWIMALAISAICSADS